MNDELNLTASRIARDKGIDSVTDNNENWFSRAIAQLEAVIKSFGSTPFSGEDLRMVLGRRIGQPEHPNAWGALLMYAKRHKLVLATEKYAPMKTISSHARRTPLYLSKEAGASLGV